MDTEDEGTFLSRTKDLFRLIARNHGDGKSSLQTPQGLNKRLLYGSPSQTKFLKEMGHDLGIRLRKEKMTPPPLHLSFELFIV
jgi:hypothetical protein